ncbi:MAG TPA: hypothetical protein VKZ45_00260, partial [Vicingaceae bacterium]|nr:hypothetical protein [Vicingaceae bacterium]
KYLLIIAFFCFADIQSGFAQVINDPVGARSTAMAGVNATLSDVWSANNNQAGLAFVEDLSAGLYYENRFLLKETSYKAGAFVLPTKTGAFGASIASFGFTEFMETRAGLSYGLKFSERFAVGVQMNYLRTSLTQEFGSKNSVTGAVGLIGKLNDEITIGAHVYNPNRSKLAEYDNERIPTVMKLGMDYRFSEKLMIVVETEKDIDFDAIVKFGVEYQFMDILYVRGGISNNPTSSAFGFGLIMKNFILEASSSFHQTLGMTPGISLIYKNPSSKNKKVKTGI